MDKDVDELVFARDMVGAAVRDDFWAGPIRDVGTVNLALKGDGTLRWEPEGAGWWWWWSATVWNEVLLSRQAGTFERLKLCSNKICSAAFYDRSWDCSQVGHSAPCVEATTGSGVDADRK